MFRLRPVPKLTALRYTSHSALHEQSRIVFVTCVRILRPGRAGPIGRDAVGVKSALASFEVLTLFCFLRLRGGLCRLGITIHRVVKSGGDMAAAEAAFNCAEHITRWVSTPQREGAAYTQRALCQN